MYDLSRTSAALGVKPELDMSPWGCQIELPPDWAPSRLGSLQIGPPPDWALSWLCFLLTGLSPDWALRSHLWHVALVFIMEHNKTLEINFVLTWSPLGFCMYSKRMWDRCCQAVNELLLRYFYQSTENLCCYIKRFSRLICTVDAPLLAWVIMLYFTIL